MTPEEIEKLWPEFEKWVRTKYPWIPDKVSLIKLWFEWLEAYGSSRSLPELYTS